MYMQVLDSIKEVAITEKEIAIPVQVELVLMTHLGTTQYALVTYQTVCNGQYPQHGNMAPVVVGRSHRYVLRLWEIILICFRV